MLCISENIIIIIILLFIFIFVYNTKNTTSMPNMQDDKPKHINISSRGSRTNYEQIGVINNKNVILPLYGRPIWQGASKYNYYTKTDSHAGVMLPVYVNGKDCTNDYGCDELYDNDTITVTQFNSPFNVEIYNLDKPRYIPYL